MIKTIKLSSDSVYNGPCGCDCRFIKIGDRGLKTYRTPEKRDRFYRNQRILENKGLAPGCDDCVDVITDEGETRYGYWTILADVADQTDRSIETRQNDCDDLQERIRIAGYRWGDVNHFNFGYINGRAVLIDCDMSPVWK